MHTRDALAKATEIRAFEQPKSQGFGARLQRSPLAPALTRLGEIRPQGSDDAARTHLRNIEQYMQRLLSESEQGRVQSTAELRNDIRVLTRTLAALAEGQPQ